MSYNIVPLSRFQQEAKRLSKKYPSLKSDLEGLSKELQADPEIGTPLGRNTYKIRLAIKSKGRGKSGGGRVITYYVDEKRTVFLLIIYDKSELENIDDKTLRQLVKAAQDRQ